MKKFMIVAGEASGDLHGANLVKEYKALEPDAVFFGIGGSRMAKVGVDLAFDASEVSVVGLTEVLKHLGRISQVLGWMRSAIDEFRPDGVVLIDFPDFNFRIASEAHRLGVPVFYYISPQVWAWRRRRVKFLSRNVNKMAVIFPFEVSFYEKSGLKAEFVGHPLLDSPILKTLDREKARTDLDIGSNDKVVALLPGSRNSEVDHHLSILVHTVERMKKKNPRLRFIMPIANTLNIENIRKKWEGIEASRAHTAIEFLAGEAYPVLLAADVAAVSSGTATLEAALAGVPTVVIYRLNPVTYFFGRLLVNVPYVGLVNLVAGREVAPELIQNELTPKNLANNLEGLLEDKERKEKAISGLSIVRDRLGSAGASQRAAKILHGMVEKKNIEIGNTGWQQQKIQLEQN